MHVKSRNDPGFYDEKEMEKKKIQAFLTFMVILGF